MRELVPNNNLVFAVTSSNQDNSRYSPVPFHIRAIGADRFAASIGARHSIYGIPHYGNNDKFASYVTKEIAEQTNGRLLMTPENTVVVSSTPAVIRMYRELGYNVLTCELESLDPPVYKAERSVDIVRIIGERGYKSAMELLSSANLDLFDDFPEAAEKIEFLYRDPILTEQGNISDDRDYDLYAAAMGNKQAIEFKYNDIREFIHKTTERIADEGCADGSLLVLISKDFPDADLIGVDIAKENIELFNERIRRGEFGESFVHIHQRNLMSYLFPNDSVDATICNSTMHEIWSYLEGDKSRAEYLEKKFRQTRKGGRIIIRDVVGPSEKYEETYLWCNSEDGADAGKFEDLSTYHRFMYFARNFMSRQMRNKINFDIEKIDGIDYFVSTMRNHSEFMTKKDYAKNIDSELKEEFAFNDVDEHASALEKAGFVVLAKKAYVNDWIVNNRLKGKVRLFNKRNGILVPTNYPVTNMVLVGEKI